MRDVIVLCPFNRTKLLLPLRSREQIDAFFPTIFSFVEVSDYVVGLFLDQIVLALNLSIGCEETYIIILYQNHLLIVSHSLLLPSGLLSIHECFLLLGNKGAAGPQTRYLRQEMLH